MSLNLFRAVRLSVPYTAPYRFMICPPPPFRSLFRVRRARPVVRLPRDGASRGGGCVRRARFPQFGAGNIL